MRASVLGLYLICCFAQAGTNGEATRVEVRATRVEVATSHIGEKAGARFTAAARVSIPDNTRDPLARFQAKAGVKAAGASCGPQGDAIFANGFE